MSSIPSNLGRVPDLLRSQYSLSTINRTNLDIFRIANQLSTGKAILRPSDDSVKAASIAAVQTRIDRAEQLSRNLQVADSSLATLDQALGEAGDLLLNPIRAAFAAQLTGRGHRPSLEIRKARLGNRAGLIGAADLARV